MSTGKWDAEQVAALLPAFLEAHAEIVATGKYTYNDSFKGRGFRLEGMSEDRTIYLLQTLKTLRELAVQVEAARADGYAEPAPGFEGKCAGIVHYGFYVGGTGWAEWKEARLVRQTAGGYAVLPKGKRTHGSVLHGSVLVKT